MINELSKRFLEVLNHLIKEKIVADNKDFASHISVSTSMITEISKGRSNVGLTAIQNTVLKFPISSDWLLTGEGSMLRNSNTSEEMGVTPNATPISSAEESLIYKMYKEKDTEVGALKEEIGALKLRIRQLESQDKEPDHPSAIDESIESFTSKSSGDYGEGFLPTRQPTTSETLSGGKM